MRNHHEFVNSVLLACFLPASCFIHIVRIYYRSMSITVDSLSPIASLLFGILILLFPKFLNYFVAAYLIIIGLLGLGIIH